MLDRRRDPDALHVTAARLRQMGEIEEFFQLCAADVSDTGTFQDDAGSDFRDHASQSGGQIRESQRVDRPRHLHDLDTGNLVHFDLQIVHGYHQVLRASVVPHQGKGALGGRTARGVQFCQAVADDSVHPFSAGAYPAPRRNPVLRLSRPSAAQRASLGITTTPEDGCIAGDRPQRGHFLNELLQHPVYGTATLKLTDSLSYDKCDAHRTVLFPVVFPVAGESNIRDNQSIHL